MSLSNIQTPGPPAPNNGGADESKPKKAKRVITVDERERDFLIGMIALVLALTTLPHLFGYQIAKTGYRFVGTGYNIDDYLVYLSWLQQTSHGHFWIRNLFTNDPQPALLFNFLLSAMGLVAAATHWSLQATIEVFRAVGAIGLLVLVYRFYRYCMPENRAARLTAFAFACFSSGFGWMKWHLWADRNPIGSPIDAWQPEAYTFTSIYVNVLFVYATMLIVGVLWGLLASVRTGKIRYAFIAGLCGFVMGDIHSYDVLHVSAAWGLFLIVWSVLRWKWGGALRAWGYGILALLFTLPTTLYVFYAFKSNPVFNSRANSPTLTPNFPHYITGYGLVMIFAVVAVVMTYLRRRQFAQSTAPASSAMVDGNEPGAVEASKADPDGPTGLPTLRARSMGWADRASMVFVWCWAVAGFLIIYVPARFQRKMLMGEHLPLCLLAGWGAAVLLRKWPKPARIAALALIVGVSFISNGFVIRRDMSHMSHNRSETQQWPVLAPTFVQALDYLKDQIPPDATVLSIPFYATYVPGFTGHTVWCGHWSETPDYEQRVQQMIQSFDASTPADRRQQFLQSTGCEYLLYVTKGSDVTFTDKHGRVHYYMDLASNPPPYLHVVYTNKDFTIFRIDRP